MSRLRCAIPSFILSCVTIAFGAASAQGAEDRNLIPEVRLDQDDINGGLVTFDELFLAGRHIFSNRFTTEDGFGEAPDGPRRQTQVIAGRPNLPFLRFNGLDSQSCLECHNSIGFIEAVGGPIRNRYFKEPGSVGGGAGSASNAYGFSNFPLSTLGFVRNPPTTFGAGYTQRLAEEMSEDLMALRDAGIVDAQNMEQQVVVPLVTKEISFGSLTIDAMGAVDLPGSSLEGVSEDLVIRPFQYKGLASTVRNFVTGAMNFHFSIQPKELIDQGLVANDNPNGTVAGDPLNEILEGEISAVAAFVSFMRPPVESDSGLDPAEVAAGRQAFDDVGCTSCHVPSLQIEDSRVTIVDPRQFLNISAQQLESETPPPPRLTVQHRSSADLAPVLQYLRHGAKSGGAEKPKLSGGTSPPDRLDGYTRDLNLDDGPIETRPRLPYDQFTEAIDVPLFSDLKRHDMGDDLAESFTSGTDVAGIEVSGREWLTRSLWGVADTAPWLHDGRALTLSEAIAQHAGTGSEANTSITAFDALGQSDRDAVIAFLQSLRLPKTPHIGQGSNAARAWSNY